MDAGLVGRDLGKLAQSSHHINQHIHRLVGQQAHQGVQRSILLEPLDKMEKLSHDVENIKTVGSFLQKNTHQLLQRFWHLDLLVLCVWRSKTRAVLRHVAEVGGALPDDPSGGDQELLVVGLLQQGDQWLEAVALGHDVTGLLVSCTLQSHTAGGGPEGHISGSQEPLGSLWRMYFTTSEGQRSVTL